MKSLENIIKESILDEPDFDRTAKDIEEQSKYFLTYKLTGNKFVNYIRFYKNTLKVNKGHRLYIFAVGGELGITAQSIALIKDEDVKHYLSLESLLNMRNIGIDADVCITLKAIDTGCVLSDLNLIGRNHRITIYYEDDDPINKKGYELIKKFFDINPDPTSIIKFDHDENWSGKILRDPLANKFAAVYINPSYAQVGMDDIHDCQAKVLMITACRYWAEKEIINNNLFTYKQYFSYLKKGNITKNKPEFRNEISGNPEEVFKKFLSDNPKTKLLVQYFRAASNWDHIYLKDNELEIDNISGENPWTKI
jgi:hypothetical protein